MREGQLMPAKLPRTFEFQAPRWMKVIARPTGGVVLQAGTYADDTRVSGAETFDVTLTRSEALELAGALRTFALTNEAEESS